MTLSIKRRLVALGAAGGLLCALLVVVLFTSEHQTNELETQLTQVNLEVFSLADHVKVLLRSLNDKFRHYRANRDPGRWLEFQEASHEIEMWVAHGANSFTTP